MMTEKELISKLQALKQVKPRENWVVFTKNQVFRDNAAKNKVFVNKLTYKERFSNVLDILSSLTIQRKLAYSLAAFLFLFIGLGLFGLMNVITNDSDVKIIQQPAALIEIKNNVKEFKAKSRTLSEVAKYNPEGFSLAVKEVEKAAKELTLAIQKDPQLAKEIALEVNNNKTYLEISGGSDLKATSDILYKTIVKQMIKDLENTTLTESQQESLKIIKDLYEQEKYASALESILLLNVAIENK